MHTFEYAEATVTAILHAKQSDRPKMTTQQFNKTVLHNKLKFCLKEQKVPLLNHFSIDYGMHNTHTHI